MALVGTTDYSYNARSQMTGVTATGISATYSYDYMGNRVQSLDGTGETNYLWDEFSQFRDVLRETDATGAETVRYNLGMGMVLSQTRGADTHFLLSDVQNSTRGLVDDTGLLTDVFGYDAFGEISSRTGTTDANYLYTGQQYDDLTGLYSLRARYYDPNNGRFLARDVWPYDYDNPVELNRYVYTANNPVMFSDPSGYFVETQENYRNSSISTKPLQGPRVTQAQIDDFLTFQRGKHTQHLGNVGEVQKLEMLQRITLRARVVGLVRAIVEILALPAFILQSPFSGFMTKLIFTSFVLTVPAQTVSAPQPAPEPDIAPPDVGSDTTTTVNDDDDKPKRIRHYTSSSAFAGITSGGGFVFNPSLTTDPWIRSGNREYGAIYFGDTNGFQYVNKNWSALINQQYQQNEYHPISITAAYALQNDRWPTIIANPSQWPVCYIDVDMNKMKEIPGLTWRERTNSSSGRARSEFILYAPPGVTHLNLTPYIMGYGNVSDLEIPGTPIVSQTIGQCQANIPIVN